jgi:hypothetical protein
MDLPEEEKKIQDQTSPVQEPQPKHYTVGVKHRYFPIERKHLCYRHEVTATGHLVLYRINNTQIALDARKRSWIIYADYWPFMKWIETEKAKKAIDLDE